MTPVRGFRLDIARHLPAKRRAIAAHRSQTTDLIADDPAGFRMPPAFRALFDQPFEVFLAGCGNTHESRAFSGSASVRQAFGASFRGFLLC